jgi:hypothetical protein
MTCNGGHRLVVSIGYDWELETTCAAWRAWEDMPTPERKQTPAPGCNGEEAWWSKSEAIWKPMVLEMSGHLLARVQTALDADDGAGT